MEKLKEELYKVVFDYSIEEKLPDKKFIETILDLCIDPFNINDYVLDRDIGEDNITENPQGAACYWINTRKVVVDIERVKTIGINRIMTDKEYGIISNTFLDYYKMNSQAMYIIVHELSHACQYKKCFEEDTLETDILKLKLGKNIAIVTNKPLTINEIEYYILLDKQTWQYYAASPSERMADITGAEFERDIAKLLDPKKKSNIEEYSKLRLLNSKIKGYDITSPTVAVTLVNETAKGIVGLPQKYKERQEVENMYNERANKLNLSFDERIRLGLPITEEEKHKVYQKIQNLRNILIKKD